MSKLQDVAKLAGVSKATVSRVINNGTSITPETRKKVTEAMRALNYHANELRRTNENTMTIGLIQPFQKEHMNNSFSLDIMVGAEEKAFENNYMLLIGDNSNRKEKEDLLVSKMFNRDVEGLIIQSAFNWNKEQIDLLKNNGVPFVWVDQKLENVSIDIVRGDNFTASMNLMNHLFSLGHKDIAMIGSTKLSTFKDRIKGYHYSMMERGYTVPDHYVITMNDDTDDYEVFKQLFSNDNRPTALMIINPKNLYGCIQIANELSIKIPEDLSVVTFDESYVSLPDPYKNFFTSVNQSGRLIGSMALELLLQHIKHPEMHHQEIVLPGTLRIRKSTAPLNID